MKVDNYTDYLTAIAANPEDDALRLAFARFVVNTDPELSRFIELQIARANRYRDEDRPPGAREPHGEEAQLLARNRDRWARYIAKYCLDGDPTHCWFHRGFVMRIVCDPELFVEHGEYIYKLVPLRHVRFAPADDGFQLSKLFASPLLARLDSISVWNATRKDIEALAESPYLIRCKTLDLRGTPLTVTDLDLLAASPTLRGLLVLNFDREVGKHLNPRVMRDYEAGELDPRSNYEFSKNVLGAMPEDGQKLEAKHGYIPWLHPEDDATAAELAHAAVEQGMLPKHRPGTPVHYDANGIPRYTDDAA